MKKCNTCCEEKPLDSFNKKNSTLNIYHSRCKDCCSIKCKEYYKNNSDKVKKRVYSRKKLIKDEARFLILEKLSKGCVDCQEKDIIVLDFDHMYDKKYSISFMVSFGYSIDSLKSELDKCVVRCALRKLSS
jgi:hypothetical protein